MRLWGPQLESLLQGEAANLTNHQRYSLIQLATTAVRANENYMAESSSEGVTEAAMASSGNSVALPDVVLGALPRVCWDLFHSRSDFPSRPANMQQRSGSSWKPQASTAAARAVDDTIVGGTSAGTAVLQLIQAQPQSSVLMPLLRYCVAAATGCPVSDSEPRKDGKDANALAAAATEIRHSGPCVRMSFLSSSALTLLVLRCRPLQSALLCHKDDVLGVVRSLVEVGKGHGDLVGDGDCKARCTQLLLGVDQLLLLGVDQLLLYFT